MNYIKNYNIKLISLILSFMLVLSSIPLSFAESFAAETYENPNELYRGEAVISGDSYYSGDISAYDEDFKPQYYYSDGYFKLSSDAYNDHLATMSVVFAMSSMYKTDINARDILKKIGCSDLENLDFDIKPTAETIGAVYAHKTIFEGTSAEATLIPITIRGGWYGLEWLNSFEIGTEGDSVGFNNASSKVLNSIDTYMHKHNISSSDAVFWVTGYSRGGTVANLLSKKLSDQMGQDKVYSYSFEAQRTAYNNKNDYPNLFSVCNFNDYISMVIINFSENEKFSYYGKQVTLGDNSKSGYADKESAMLNELDKYSSREGFASPTNFQFKKINHLIPDLADYSLLEIISHLDEIEGLGDSFLQNDKANGVTQRDCMEIFFSRLKYRAISNRKAFSDNSNKKDKSGKNIDINSAMIDDVKPYSLQEAVQAIFRYDEEKTNASEDAIVENFENFPIEKYIDINNITLGTLNDAVDLINKAQALLKFLKDLKITNEFGSYKSMVSYIWKLANTSYENKDNPEESYYGFDDLAKRGIITEQQLRDIKGSIPILLYSIAAVTAFDIGETPETVTSIVSNFDYINQMHYPEINYAWLRLNDSFYVGDKATPATPTTPIELKEYPESTEESGGGGSGRGGGSGGGAGGGEENPPVEKTDLNTPSVIESIQNKIVLDTKTQNTVISIPGLVEGVDYTVQYLDDNNKVGKHKARITGIGDNYKGTVAVEFIVLPKGTSVSKLSPAIKSLTIKLKKQSVQTSGYQIRYSLKSTMSSSKTATIKSNKTVSKKIKGLKSKKKYYIQVRTYTKVNEAGVKNTYYSSWSKTKSVKVK